MTVTITLTGPQGCGKTRWAEFIRGFASHGDLPQPIIIDGDEYSPPAKEPFYQFKVNDTARHDLTLRELQTNLPWTVRYSSDFRASPMSHKDFAHALTHVHKAGGALAAIVDDMDHRKEVADDPLIRETHVKYLADMVICAIRMANTFPGGVVDLQRAVEDRLESKNDVKLPRPGR